MSEQGAALSYNGLREELKKCFGVEGHMPQYRSMLKARRRQPGESLRSLYQDMCRLMMLAYPGPQSELRDQLAVEAFVDSLDEAELKIRVKDRFPKDLAEAFQIALRLEANSPGKTKAEEVPKEKERSRRLGRSDIETRRVDIGDQSELCERLSRLEQHLRDKELESKLSKKDEEIARMQSQIENIKLHSKFMEEQRDWKLQEKAKKEKTEVKQVLTKSDASAQVDVIPNAPISDTPRSLFTPRREIAV